MNLHTHLKVEPGGWIQIPAEFHKHMGLPEGPVYIEATLCIDGYVELGPVIPGSEFPRNHAADPDWIAPGTLDDPLPADELAAWESDRELSTGDLPNDESHSSRSEDREVRVQDIVQEIAKRSAELNRRLDES